jgi:hypothetical protein
MLESIESPTPTIPLDEFNAKIDEWVKKEILSNPDNSLNIEQAKYAIFACYS